MFSLFFWIIIQLSFGVGVALLNTKCADISSEIKRLDCKQHFWAYTTIVLEANQKEDAYELFQKIKPIYKPCVQMAIKRNEQPKDFAYFNPYIDAETCDSKTAFKDILAMESVDLEDKEYYLLLGDKEESQNKILEAIETALNYEWSCGMQLDREHQPVIFIFLNVNSHDAYELFSDIQANSRFEAIFNEAQSIGMILKFVFTAEKEAFENYSKKKNIPSQDQPFNEEIKKFFENLSMKSKGFVNYAVNDLSDRWNVINEFGMCYLSLFEFEKPKNFRWVWKVTLGGLGLILILTILSAVLAVLLYYRNKRAKKAMDAVDLYAMMKKEELFAPVGSPPTAPPPTDEI